jgi:hypothetical protein
LLYTLNHHVSPGSGSPGSQTPGYTRPPRYLDPSRISDPRIWTSLDLRPLDLIPKTSDPRIWGSRRVWGGGSDTCLYYIPSRARVIGISYFWRVSKRDTFRVFRDVGHADGRLGKRATVADFGAFGRSASRCPKVGSLGQTGCTGFGCPKGVYSGCLWGSTSRGGNGLSLWICME